MVSLSDIAREVNLNVSVVSRALSPNPAQNAKVKAETRARIRETAERMNYIPNRQASFMGRKSNATIFCFMPQSSDRLTADLMYGISEAARRENFPVTFFQGSVCEDFRKFFSGLDDSTHSGVISFPSQALADDLKDMLKFYAQRRKTLVLLNPNTNAAKGLLEDEYSSITQVIMDDTYGGRLAAQHLWEQGCRKFYFTYLEGQPFMHRLKGFQDFLAEKGFEVGSFDKPEALKDVISGSEKVGIYADRDVHALNVLIHLARLGVTPGERVLLVGNDDKQQSRFSVPTLTTVHQPTKEEGFLAVKKLINLIFGGTEANELVKPYLIVRQSTGNMNEEYIIR